MVNNSKKDVVLPQLRVTKEMADELYVAAEKLGLNLPNFRRQVFRDLIRIADEGEKPALPARVLTLQEEEILLRARGGIHIGGSISRPLDKEMELRKEEKVFP